MSSEQRLPQRQADRVFAALNSGTRRSVLVLLATGERTVSEIVAEFDLAQATISRHLSILQTADLVRDDRRGQHVVYSLERQTLIHVGKWFFGQF